MHVAVVAPQFPKLSETFILDHVVRLLDGGHEVVVLASRPTADEPTHPDVEKYRLTQRTCYPPGLTLDPPWRYIQMTRISLESLARAPRSSVNALRGRAVSRGKAGTLLTRFAHVQRVGDQDIFHCHYGPTGAWLSGILLDLRFRGRLVTTFHGHDVSKYVERHGKDVYRQLFGRGDLFLPVSEFWRNRLLELGAPAERTLVQRMGVDCRRFGLVIRNHRADGSLRVLSVGRLVPKKGFEYGLQAVAAANRAGSLIRYTIVGDGPERGALEALASQLGIAEFVTFVGQLPRNEVHALMVEHDILLVPSVTSAAGDQEGIPVVLMEAMSTGMAVIASRHSGIPELVRDGDTGLLAEERSFEQITRHLQRLAADHDLRQRLGRRGREAVIRSHDTDALTNQLVVRYRELLESHPVREGN